MSANMLSAVLDKTKSVNIVDSLLLAVLGIALVFVILILLMFIVWLTGKIFDNSVVLREKHPEWNDKIQKLKASLHMGGKSEKTAKPEVQTTVEKEYAKGTCGELVLTNVEERDAAMIMAIVADQTKTPLNELRFKSIKRIDEEK